jgi:hypothetical protein
MGIPHKHGYEYQVLNARSYMVWGTIEGTEVMSDELDDAEWDYAQ